MQTAAGLEGEQGLGGDWEERISGGRRLSPRELAVQGRPHGSYAFGSEESGLPYAEGIYQEATQGISVSASLSFPFS